MQEQKQLSNQNQLLSSTQINFFQSLLSSGAGDDVGQKTKRLTLEHMSRKQASRDQYHFMAKTQREQQNLKNKTQQTLQKYQQKYQKNMTQQITRLNEQIQKLQSHCNILSLNCQQKRQQISHQLQNMLQLEDKYDQLQAKYLGLSAQHKRKEDNLQIMYEKKIKDIESKNNKQKNILNSTILELEIRNKQLQQLLISTETEYNKIKEILALQRIKKKQKQEENIKIQLTLSKEIDGLKSQINKLKKSIGQQSKINAQKSLHMQSMEKTMKEMNRRCMKIQTQSRKQIIKQRTITKKALQGLQMTRKYSEMELNKSRKKQKEYINSQKQLICKIKEICKDQSVIDTTHKSSRKTEVKSLNTTLKLTRPQRQVLTPMVSNFMAEDDATLNLSPIHQVSQFQTKQDPPYPNQSTRSNITKPNHKTKHKIDINPNYITDPQAAGTPCFEHHNNTNMFKACR